VERLERFLSRYHELAEKSPKETIEARRGVSVLRERLGVALQALKKSDPYTDSVVEVDLAAVGLWTNDIASVRPSVRYERYKNEFSLSGRPFDSHDNRRILEERILHLDRLLEAVHSTQSQIRNEAHDSTAELGRLLRDATGKLEQGEQTRREKVAETVAGGFLGAATGFAMNPASSMTLNIVTTAIGAVAGVAISLVPKIRALVRKRRELRELASKDYGGEAERLSARTKAQTAAILSNCAQAIETCEKGLDTLIAAILAKLPERDRKRIEATLAMPGIMG